MRTSRKRRGGKSQGSPRGQEEKAGSNDQGETIPPTESIDTENQGETIPFPESVNTEKANPDESSLPPSGETKRQKRDKFAAVLSEGEEQTMVEWLEANPILYNKKLKTYKDTAKKEALWREKALEMQKEEALLKTWYTSLRTRYGRLRKFCSGQEPPEMTERDLWIIRSFEFLKPHIVEVPKRTLVSVCIY